MMERFTISAEGAAKAQIELLVDIYANIRVLRDFVLHRYCEREGIDKQLLADGYTKDLEAARERIIDQLYADHGIVNINEIVA